MPGRHYDNMEKPQKRGPYLMKPGDNSRVSKYENVNFRDSDIKKAAMFPNMYPQNFAHAAREASKAGDKTFQYGGETFPVTSKAKTEMHHAGMYNAQFHGGKHPNQQKKETNTIAKDTTPSRAEVIIQNRKETANMLNAKNPPKPKQPNKYKY